MVSPDPVGVPVFPVMQIGELIGGGILRNALTALTSKDDERFPSRRWRVFYYCVMCMLFAVTTVSVFEWVREISGIVSPTLLTLLILSSRGSTSERQPIMPGR